jgi:hypothetical protein
MREPGFYWVKRDEQSEWQPAEWSTENWRNTPCWLLIGTDSEWAEGDFIAGPMLEPPA